MADIFVSYTSADRDWAFWIGQELERLGHKPRIHEWEINSGDDIYAWMQKHHDAADHVLCVISDEYLLAPYSTLERNAALWQAVHKRPGFVLFVAVKPCRIPSLSDHIRRCELHGIDEEVARERLTKFLTPAGRPRGPMVFPGAPATATSTSPMVFPGGSHALSNIPITVPLHFLGRGDELNDIKNALSRGDGRVAITALHGLRGVGKTTLAAAYAERHRGDYRATWWIRAQTDSGMRADLVALGVRLGWVAADEKEAAALAAVMERLGDEGAGVLLIFDNAIDPDSIRSFLPRGGSAQILVTSNAPNWRGIAAPVEIEVWPKEVGADYLIARTGRDGEREAALALSDLLGGLPLAHEQAGAYCERLDISLAEYRKRFEAAPEPMLDDQRDASRDYHDGMTVAKTFALAIDEAAKLHPAAEPLIVHAALLAPEPIPLFLFAEAREKFGKPFASASAGNGLDEAVVALRSFALIDREAIADERDPSITTDCIRLHRLVRQVAAVRRERKARKHTQRALVRALAAVYPKEVYHTPETWPRARRLDAIVLAVVTGDVTLPDRVEKPVTHLLNQLALYRQSALAAYADAQPLFERALVIREKVKGPEHRDTAESLHNLAGLLQDQGNLAAAQPLFERALVICEKVNGPEHLDTATCLNNLALLLKAQSDLAAARPLYERALAIFEKVSGAEHPNKAASLLNLADLARTEGDTARALLLFRRALEISEKCYGLGHPSVATALGHIAFVLALEGDHEGAWQRYDRALMIFGEVLDLDHPEIQKVAGHAARALDALGRAEKARALREKYGIEAAANGTKE